MSNHTFAKVPSISIPRSSFDRSSDYKTTFNEGYLIPFFIDEVLPGDTYNVNATLFGRLSTPLEFPIMDNMYIDTFWFFVPNRLIWTNFKRFMGERDPNPSSSISYLFPQVPAPTTTGFAIGTIYDYFGVPTEKDGFSINNYGRAYNLIYNEWFRDQNLQDSAVVDLDDGPDVASDYPLLKRGKRHDYFTSCLPYPQKGSASVTLPLGTSAPVIGDGNPMYLRNVGSSTDRALIGEAVGNLYLSGGVNAAVKGSLDPTKSGLIADLSTATAASINSLRQAIALQQFYELDARGGTRYIEMNLAHFGVQSSDSRLQRPEFLGSSSNRIGVNPVAQTSKTDGAAAQANVAAYSTFGVNRAGFVKSFEEHGVILALCSVRADLTYQQGIHKMWSRRTREDFFWPTFAEIGEQAVLNQEIFYSDNAVTDAAFFGYQERYGCYRYKPSLITGQFRSDFATSLDSWHLSQDFASVPTLNSTFIQETPPIDRVVAVAASAHFLLDAHIQCICARPMKVYSVPGLSRI